MSLVLSRINKIVSILKFIDIIALYSLIGSNISYQQKKEILFMSIAKKLLTYNVTYVGKCQNDLFLTKRRCGMIANEKTIHKRPK